MTPPNEELTLEVERILPADRLRVFGAFTDADQLVQWWGPVGFTIPAIEFDPRVGGSYRIEMKPPEADPFALIGEFRVVEPPERLALGFVCGPMPAGSSIARAGARRSTSSRPGCSDSVRHNMWPREAIEFLRELEANNDRDWFRANRDRYDRDLVEPARELATELAHLGEPHLFRPYNDTRFHMRPPIKEQLGLAIGHRGAGGYYVELSLDGLLVAAGLHAPASDQLSRYRAAIDDGRRAAAFERALSAAGASGLEPAPPQLKRAPRGYPVDHPRVERLRMKEITVYRRHALEPWLHTPKADARIRAELDAARPLVAWLAKHVGPHVSA